MEYFAYGSNMLTRRLRKRVPTAIALGPARLPQHRLTWDKPSSDQSGKCSVVPDPECEVWGVLFKINERERDRLDKAEGLGHGYEKQTSTVEGPEGDVEAFFYVATEARPGAKPYDWYKAFVVNGAEEHGLPGSYVAALKAVEADFDTEERRRAENAAILNGR